MNSIKRSNKMSNVLRMFSMIVLCGLFGFNAMAGSTGEIRGMIKDSQGSGVPGAGIKVTAGGLFVSSASTDINGIYSVKNLEPGKYDLEVVSLGLVTHHITGISVSANKTAYQDVVMTDTSNVMGEVKITAVKAEKPIIDKEFSSIKTLDIDQIQNIAGATGDVNGMVTAIAPDVQQTNDGKGLYMRGARANATAMMIDGMRVIGSADIPSTSIGGLMVLTGGVPAEYGDFTGGLVVITTKSYTQGIREKRVRNFEARERKKEREAEEQQKKQEQKKQEQQN